MKNIFFLGLFILLFFTGYTQTIKLVGGLNTSSVKAEDNDSLYSQEFFRRKTGHIGLNVEFELKEHFFFETGLIYSSKGYGYNVSKRIGSPTFTATLSQVMNYIDLPLRITYKVDINPQLKAFLATGAYVGVLLNAEVNRKTGSSAIELPDVKIGSSEEDNIKPYDHGLVFGVGLESELLQFGAFYDLGLSDISPNNENDFKMKNRMFRFSIAFKIGELKQE